MCTTAAKRRYERLKAAGLCTRCGAAPASRNSINCGPCRAGVRQALAADRAFRLDYGQCARAGCDRDAAPGVTMCPAHLRRNRAIARKQRERNAAAGRCSCGRPAAAGKTACERCRRSQRSAVARLEAARRALGLCPRCGGPVAPGRRLCRRHLEQAAAWAAAKRERRAAAGVAK